MAMMCSKNAKGAYCMKVFEKFETDAGTNERDTACKNNCTSCSKTSQKKCKLCENNIYGKECANCAAQEGAGCTACVNCYKTNDKLCSMDAASKQKLEDSGCCFGTMVAMAALDKDPKSSKMDIAHMNRELEKCGISSKISSTPCATVGIKMSSVKSDVVLGGITVAQFDTKAQQAFKSGTAKTAGVQSNQVSITSFKEKARRSTGLEVKSEVILMGDDTSKASSMKAKLNDKAALQTNLKAADAGSALSTSDVKSTNSKTGFTVESSNVSSGAGAMAGSAFTMTLLLFVMGLCSL